MQVPEKLSLIGGSILLASTLVFTLKSQASQILPKINDASSKIFDHIGDTQKSSNFESNYQNAQKHGWKGGEPTGHWGTSKYYIDKDKNMHIGQGVLQGSIVNNLGWDTPAQIRTVSFDQSIKLPSDSGLLFANMNDMQQMNGVDNLDASSVGSMYAMFQNDSSIQSLNLSHWNVSSLTTNFAMFQNAASLRNVNVDWQNTSKLTNVAWSFDGDASLAHLDLSSWHVKPTVAHDHIVGNDSSLKDLNISGMDTSPTRWDDYVFGGYNDSVASSLLKLTLGDKSIIQGKEKLPNATWKNDGQTLSTAQLNDGNAHPGTWIRQ